VKKGKQERYVKDDIELNAYLLQLALENAALHVNDQAPAISDTALESIAQEYMRTMLIFDRLERKISRDILAAMLNVTPITEADLNDASQLEAYGQRLLTGLNDRLDESSHYRLDVRDKEGQLGLALISRVHGNDHEVELDTGFFQSPDYAGMASLAAKLDSMLSEGAFIKRGEREQPVASFKDVMDWLIAESKRGLNIQRYKGLGEMNPGQLWETTMDPESRRMLQVSIEDAMAADEVFDTLMGDQVEPRREFIERNALSVANLDV